MIVLGTNRGYIQTPSYVCGNNVVFVTIENDTRFLALRRAKNNKKNLCFADFFLVWSFGYCRGSSEE